LRFHRLLSRASPRAAWSPDALVADCASTTKKIRLGTAVVVLPLFCPHTSLASGCADIVDGARGACRGSEMQQSPRYWLARVVGEIPGDDLRKPFSGFRD
jgi:hypothetical protein